MRTGPLDTRSLILLISRLTNDWRLWLVGFCCILGGFGVVWALVLRRTLEDVSPFFRLLASQSGLNHQDIEGVIFGGPGKMLRTLIGGDRISLENAMDLLSIALVHPLAVGLVGLWAMGRGTALVGELDRGTLELLLSQPVTRRLVNLSHLLFDLITWPLLALCLCGGLAFGTWWINPIQEKPMAQEMVQKMESAKPWWMRVQWLQSEPKSKGRPFAERMRLTPENFLKATPSVAALGFAMSGITYALSAFGRSRIKMLGILSTLFFLMYLANLLAQLFQPMEWVRPLTVFYYYHPQELVLGQGDWLVLREWGLESPRVPALFVLLLTGLLGYWIGSRHMERRDLPVPL
jgi:ABC-2 type transport system permease protein